MSVEAMKQALEALEEIREYEMLGLEFKPIYHEIIIALRQAIEEAEHELPLDENVLRQWKAEFKEQEPVAWMDATGFIYKIKPEPTWPEVQPLKPLYAHPPKREPLTDEQILVFWKQATLKPSYTSELVKNFAREIGRAHV